MFKQFLYGFAHRAASKLSLSIQMNKTIEEFSSETHFNSLLMTE